MKNFVGKVIYFFFVTVFVVSAVFISLRFAPGDPVERILGPNAKIEEIQALRTSLGLDKSILQQYSKFLVSSFQFDLGYSLFKGKKVLDMIKENIVPTSLIALIATLLSFFFGVASGVVSGINHRNKIDFSFRFLAILALSFPIFSLGPLLVILFAIKFQLFPVSEWGTARHLFLPCLTLIIPMSSVIARVTRNKFLEEKGSLWVQVLVSKGLSEFQIVLRVLLVCLPTIFNVIAIQLSVLLAGTLITENIFDIPGLGSLLLEGIQNRDYPVVQGVILYSSIIYMFIYFTFEVLNMFIDPRLQEKT
jgi:peptide/nickel transport system permease protein